MRPLDGVMITQLLNEDGSLVPVFSRALQVLGPDVVVRMLADIEIAFIRKDPITRRYNGDLRSHGGVFIKWLKENPSSGLIFRQKTRSRSAITKEEMASKRLVEQRLKLTPLKLPTSHSAVNISSASPPLQQPDSLHNSPLQDTPALLRSHRLQNWQWPSDPRTTLALHPQPCAFCSGNVNRHEFRRQDSLEAQDPERLHDHHQCTCRERSTAVNVETTRAAETVKVASEGVGKAMEEVEEAEEEEEEEDEEEGEDTVDEDEGAATKDSDANEADVKAGDNKTNLHELGGQ